jgi:hypothetical protein
VAALQAPGRKRLEARVFTAGRPIPPGTVLGDERDGDGGDGVGDGVGDGAT